MNLYLEGRAYKNSSRPTWWEMVILDLPLKGDLLLIDNSKKASQRAIKLSMSANSHICY